VDGFNGFGTTHRMRQQQPPGVGVKSDSGGDGGQECDQGRFDGILKENGGIKTVRPQIPCQADRPVNALVAAIRLEADDLVNIPGPFFFSICRVQSGWLVTWL
jgi:hypothetical protein